MSGPDVPISKLRQSLPQRLRAAAIHLSLSGIAFAVAFWLILFVWYPGFHFRVDGGWQGVRIMAAVDLVLGPLLTLVIFNPFKARRLIVFDLACIGVAQTAALAWGFYAIHSQHPVAVSFQDATFHPVLAAPVKAESFPLEDLAKFSDQRPPLVWVRPAENDDEKARISIQSMVGGASEYEDPFFFTAFADHWAEVKAAGRTLAQQEQKDAAAAAEFRSAGGPADALFFDYDGRFGRCAIAFSPAGRLLGGYGCTAD